VPDQRVIPATGDRERDFRVGEEWRLGQAAQAGERIAPLGERKAPELRRGQVNAAGKDPGLRVCCGGLR
jgi:hypothetical protein